MDSRFRGNDRENAGMTEGGGNDKGVGNDEEVGNDIFLSVIPVKTGIYILNF